MSRKCLVLCFCALMVCACDVFSLSDDGGGDDGSAVVVPETVLKLGVTEKVLSDERQEFVVEVVSSGDFKVDEDIPWLSVRADAKDASKLIVSVDENEEYEDRYGTVTVSLEELSEVIRITQKQKKAIILAADRYETGREGGLIRVALKTNVSVEVSISDDAGSWISLNETKGLQDKEIEFVVAPSEEPDVRCGEIVIAGEGETAHLSIYQAGEPVLVLGDDEFTVSSQGGVVKVELSTNVEYDIIMPQADWIAYEPSTRAIVTGTETFNVAANESYDARECEIGFAGRDGGIVQKVRVVQMQKDAVVLADTSVEVDGAAGAFSLTLASNVDYDVEIDAGWLALSQTRAMVEEELTFAYEANETLEVRTAVISFISEAVRQQVTVTQNPLTAVYVLGITHVNQSFSLPYLSGSMLEAAVYWGDGSSEKYSPGAVHDYVTAGEVRSEIHIEGGKVAPSVSFEDMVGIVELDFSGM